MGESYGNQYTSPGYNNYTYDQLVVDVQQLASELDRTPTTDDAMKDERLPCLERIYNIAENGWLGVLEDAGLELTQVEAYGPDDREAMLDDLRASARAVATNQLTTREYDELGSFATSTVKKTFGSWKEACAEAEISAGTKHGTACSGPNGERFESRLERDVARWLDEHGIDYVTHPSVARTNWHADFRLPGSDLWIEVDGYPSGCRPNEESFERKLEHYEATGLDFIVVTDCDDLEGKLLERWGLNSW